MKLYEVAIRYSQTLQGLSERDIPDQALEDTIESLEGELTEKGQAISAFLLNMEAEAEAIKQVEHKLATRRKALENRAEWFRQYLKTNMERCGITEIRAIDESFVAKLEMDRDEAVIVDHMDELPMIYKREVPAEYHPDKELIKRAIKQGYEVPGARIEKRSRLTIK